MSDSSQASGMSLLSNFIMREWRRVTKGDPYNIQERLNQMDDNSMPIFRQLYECESSLPLFYMFDVNRDDPKSVDYFLKNIVHALEEEGQVYIQRKINTPMLERLQHLRSLYPTLDAIDAEVHDYKFVFGDCESQGDISYEQIATVGNMYLDELSFYKDNEVEMETDHNLVEKYLSFPRIIKDTMATFWKENQITQE